MLLFFFAEPTLPLIPSIGPSPNTRKLFFEYQHEVFYRI